MAAVPYTNVDPRSFELAIMHGWNSAVVNRAARRWLEAHEPGAHFSQVPGVVGAKTSAAYTVIDLSAPSTPAERSAAMAYMREVSRLQHATRTHHMFLVYDMHLVSPRSFLNLGYARVLATTSRCDAVNDTVRSTAVFLRVPCQLVVPPVLANMAKSAVAGQCVAAARKYSHESLKTCLDPNMAYLALLEAVGGMGIEELAETEHVSHLVTRPAHALELAAIQACRSLPELAEA